MLSGGSTHQDEAIQTCLERVDKTQELLIKLLQKVSPQTLAEVMPEASIHEEEHLENSNGGERNRSKGPLETKIHVQNIETREEILGILKGKILSSIGNGISLQPSYPNEIQFKPY